MNTRICTEADCGKKHYGLGLCSPHYFKMRDATPERVARLKAYNATPGRLAAQLAYGRKPESRRLQKAWKAARRTEFRKLLAELKGAPCADCSVPYPTYVMQFDHTSGEKAFEISRASLKTVAEIMDEVKKCDLVCSNCHAERTYRRRHA
jgi:hypothetical protein